MAGFPFKRLLGMVFLLAVALILGGLGGALTAIMTAPEQIPVPSPLSGMEETEGAREEGAARMDFFSGIDIASLSERHRTRMNVTEGEISVWPAEVTNPPSAPSILGRESEHGVDYTEIQKHQRPEVFELPVQKGEELIHPSPVPAGSARLERNADLPAEAAPRMPEGESLISPLREMRGSAERESEPFHAEPLLPRPR